MLREKAEKIVKAIFAGVTMALCVAAINPAVQVHAGMRTENNSPASATVLQLNTEMRGVTRTKGVWNWYQFTVPEKGWSQISLQKGSDNPKNAKWRIYLQDDEFNELIDVTAYRYTSYRIGLAPGKYYIKIVPVLGAGDRDTYSLKVNYGESAAWETEKYYRKKSIKYPNIVMPNQECTGNLYCSSDSDWYRFKMDGINGAILRFEADGFISEPSKWKVEFYNARTKKKLKSVQISQSGEIYKNSYNSTQIVTGKRFLKVAQCDGDIIVRVSKQLSKAVGQVYHLELTPTLGSTSVTASSSLSRVYLQWKQVNGATEYDIYRSTSSKSGYSKINTVTGYNNYTDSNVVKNKTYYYKVVAVRNGVAADPSAYVRIKVR
ncbi:hypothetical protein [Blautia sp.]